jgi:hypothetical protein
MDHWVTDLGWMVYRLGGISGISRSAYAVPIAIDRNFPAPAFGEVKAIQDSGVVDGVQMWDQLTSWWPRVLWAPETPHGRGDPQALRSLASNG